MGIRSRDKRFRELDSGIRLRVDPQKMKRGSKISRTWELVEKEALLIDEQRTIIIQTKVERTLKISEVLHQAHEKLANYGDGVFLAWTRDRIKIPRTTAWRWNRLWDCFQKYDCSTLKQSFNLGALYELSQQGLKEKVRQEAFDLAKKGEFITKGVAERIIDRHQTNPRKLTNKIAANNKKKPDPTPDDPGPLNRETYLDMVRDDLRKQFAERLRKLSVKHLLYLEQHFERYWKRIHAALTNAAPNELERLESEMESNIKNANKNRITKKPTSQPKRTRPKVSALHRHNALREMELTYLSVKS